MVLIRDEDSDVVCAFDQPAENVVIRSGAHALFEGFDEGQVGWHALRVVGTPIEHEPAGGRGVLPELRQESRLADAGLAGDECDATLSPPGSVQPLG